ncbi:cubilin-like [Glandiceps talaboti]
MDEFDTELNYDWLEVGQGTTVMDYATLLYRFSGSEVTGSYTTPKDQAWFLWTTDNSVTAEGFSIRLRAVDPCGGTIVATSGQVSSPHYPNYYPHNSNCVWTIQVSASKTIKISFSDFDLEENYDFVLIGGTDTVGVDTVAELTGGDKPKDIIIDSHMAWIHFTSDLSGDGAGFSLDFEEYSEELLPAKPCGGDYHVKYDSILYIQSPNYPQSYYNNEHCVWNFTADVGMLISAYFRDFITESGFDWVDLGDGMDHSDMSTRLVHHSGDTLPTPLLSNGRHLWMTFSTDDTVVYRGFMVQLLAVNDTDSSVPKPSEPVVTTPEPVICGGHLVVPADGSIDVMSPNYPDDYSNDVACDWTVNSTTGRRIRVVYNDFHTERRFDYLEIGDGLDWTVRRTRHKKHTGTRLPYPYTTQTNEIWLRFVTDESISYAGFHITLQEEVGCEGSQNLTIPSGGHVTVESPYYSTGPYDNNMYCQWAITADQGSNIRVSIRDFETELHYDWVDIGTGLNVIDLSSRLLHMSGTQLTEYTTMSSDQVWMTFTSDWNIVDSGFQIELYDDGCLTETLTESSGTIQSPMYPANYPHNSNCIWIIHVSDDHHFSAQISLVFNDFELEDRYDNLLIGIGDDPDNEPEWTLTGSDLPDEIEIRAPTAWLRFQSDFTIAKRGFDISYEVECPDDYEFGHGGHCYKFVPTNSTWDDARDDCQQQVDGELVVIETEDELDYIRGNMFDSVFWIGYNDRAEESVWRWTDCSYSNEWQLSNWAGGQPTNGPNEDCAITTLGDQWADQDCNLKYAFVCEIIRKNHTKEDMNVDNVEGEALSPSSIHVTWDISDINCDVIGYRVKYHRLDWAEGAFIVYVDGGTTSETTLINLQSSTWYMIYVAAQLRSDSLDYVPGNPVQTHEVVKRPAPTPPAQKPCGGEYIAKNGTYLRITSPNYPGNYNNDEYCEWKVSAMSGNALLVHLRDLRTEHRYDWLDIGEGSKPNDTDTRVHQISGFLRPWRFWTSSSHEIWISFSTDHSRTFKGFVLDIEEIFTDPPTEKPVPTEPAPIDLCGGNITISEGEVQEVASPNYPANYDNDLECLWYINTESGARVNVTFLSFYTEYCHDWLEIGNGFNFKDLTTSAVRLSGDLSPDPFYAAGDKIWMTFITDYSITYQGFYLLVSEMKEPEEECGYHITLPSVEGASETITTPNHPDHYNSNDHCKWTVSIEDQPTPGYHVLVKINSFDLEANFDWLEIGEGSREDDFSSLLYRLTGTTVQGSYSTDTDQVWTLFTSDGSVPLSGFNITFIVVPVCGGHFTAEVGTIYSPVYPHPYPHGSLCTWTIDINADAVQIVFDVFGTEEGFDHLYIGEGLTPNIGYTFTWLKLWELSTCIVESVENSAGDFESLSLRACLNDLTGSELPKDTVVNSGQVWLQFISDTTLDGPGFDLTYSEYEDYVLGSKDCSGNITLKENGTLSIQSANYPTSYYNNHRCEWNIVSESGLPMIVNYRDFQTERFHDWVDIGYGLDNSDASTRIRHTSGDYLPTQLLVNSPSLWITFYTDDSVVFRGFLLEIEEYEIETSPPKPAPIAITTTTTSTPPPESCGGFIELTSDDVYNLTSPGYPYNDYPNDLSCEWIVNTTHGSRIRVSIIDFKTERLVDYLEYGNGNDPDVRYSLVRRRSGTWPSTAFSSETERVWFKFVTDHSVTERGFFIQLKMDEDCIEHVSIPAGGSVTIETPDYSGTGYENNIFCQWFVTTESGLNIRFNVLDFNTEEWFDWMDLGTGSYSADLSTRVLHVSGDALNDPVDAHYTSSNSVWLTFTSDRTIRQEGFQIQFYDDVCNSTHFTTTPGEIVSPYYPNLYAHNADCLWTIVLQDASIIKLTVQDFNVEFGYDKLYVTEADIPNPEYYQELTGVIPQGTEYITESNQLSLRFKTDWTRAMTGFRITFDSDCPDGYDAGLNGKCYRFVEEEGVSWHDARLECMTANNGDLVIVNDEEELDYLRSEMNGQTFWIGLSYIEWEHDWLWIDCSGMTPWQQDQWNGDVPTDPNDVGDEMCAASNGNWTGYECITPLFYICELNIKDFTGEDLNPTDLTGHALSISAIYINWDAPEYSCDIMGYNISYEVQDQSWTSINVVVEGAMNTDYRLMDLLADTTYVITVRSHTFRGNVQPGMTTIVATLAPKPTQPAEPTPKSCGGHFTIKPGTALEITSPGYPGHYGNNEYCEWVIGASEGKVLKVSVWEFDTEYGYDFVDLGNGDDPSDLETQFRRLSGSLDIQTHLSEMDHMWLVFTSDGSVTHTGFVFEFEEVEPVEDPTEKPEIGTTIAPSPAPCGGNVTVFDEPVEVLSPNYPSHYDNNLECLWSIVAPEGRRILINITDFETEAAFDWVTMGTGLDSSNRKSIFKFLTGSVYLEPFDANSNQMWMTLTTDHTNTRKGFSITFQELKSVDCGGSFIIPPGGHVGIFSPNYPAQYDNNEFCEWIIQADPTRSILVNVRSFHTEDQYDWVDMGSGDDSTNRTTMLKHMTGHYPSHQFSTLANEMWVTFISDGSVTRQGFSIEFSEDDVCGTEHLTDANGFVTSPNFPNNYPNSINCVWIIDITANLSVKLDFLSFETEAGFDWLIIGNGDNPNENEQHRFTGSELPPTIISDSNAIWLRFSTDYSITYQGWFLLYEGVYVTPEPPTTTLPPTPSSTPCTPCGGILEDFDGDIISCPYPDGSYCEWKVRQETGKFVYMEIDMFDISSGFDWLYIGHGPNVSTDSTLQQLTGTKGDPDNSATKVPDEVVSLSNEAWIVFESSQIPTSMPQFIIKFSITDEEPEVTIPAPEEHELTEPAGPISSPNWPDPYGNNMDILWQIILQKGRLVRIKITQFFTEENHDFLTIGSGDIRGQRVLSRLSGSLVGTRGNGGLSKRAITIDDVVDEIEIISEDFGMWLAFTTDDSNIDQGFYLDYDSLDTQEENCAGSDITEPEGSVTSPNYPDNYPNNADCVWIITLPDGYEDQRIQITFDDFDLEYQEDYLILGSGDDIDENILAAYTGHTLPQPWTSPDSVVWLRFTSDESVNKAGFNLNYKPTTDIPEPICPTVPAPVVTTKEVPVFPEDTYTASIIIYNGNSTWFTDQVQQDFAQVIATVLNDWCPQDPAYCLVGENAVFESDDIEFLELEDVNAGLVMDVKVQHPEIDGEYALTQDQLETMLTENEDVIENQMGFDYEVVDRSLYETEDEVKWWIILLAVIGAVVLVLLIILIIYCIRQTKIDKPWLKDSYHVADVEKNKPGKAGVLTKEDIPEELDAEDSQNAYSFMNPVRVTTNGNKDPVLIGEEVDLRESGVDNNLAAAVSTDDVKIEDNSTTAL